MRACIVFRPLSAQAARDPKSKTREGARFKSSWSATLDLLKTELERIDVDEGVIEVDVDESAIRADGSVRLNTTFRSPRVALSFTHPKAGPLRYPADRFHSWSDNVRAIALGLEHLRTLDRYGITTRGEQYTGWKAIPPSTSPTMTTETAAAFLAARANLDRERLLKDSIYARDAIRREMAVAHPDKGGSAEVWHAIQVVKEILERHHGAAA